MIEVALADPIVARYLSEAEMREAMDPSHHVGVADILVDQVLMRFENADAGTSTATAQPR